MMMLLLKCIFISVFLNEYGNCLEIKIEHVPVAELFTVKIESKMFNWTFQGVGEQQFTYRPSLEGYPDLPSWMQYVYSDEHHAGYLYGTPPEKYTNGEVRLDVVALNRQNYETRKLKISMNIEANIAAANLVQMKIDNLDWIHFMDPGRVENLKNIFRNDLWPISNRDLHLVFMESAVRMGGRNPLRPQQREGVIIHLGSNAAFSTQLKDLQEEVRPLYKLTSCTYKRTSVQKIFEDVGFKLDWCAFRILGNDVVPEVLYHNQVFKNMEGEIGTLKRMNRWEGICKDEAPQRNYIDEFAFAFAIPGMIFAVLVGLLSVILCFQHFSIEDKQSEEFFQNIFHTCEDYLSESRTSCPTIQMVQYSDVNNQPTTILKSLKDPNLLDNMSLGSPSPSNSLSHNDDNLSKEDINYLRPLPPPYKSASIGKNDIDI